MSLQLSSVHVHGHVLTLTIKDVPGSSYITVLARKGRHQVRLRITHRARTSRHHHKSTVLTFSATLSGGRWKLTVLCTPPAGYATPKPVRRTITI
jgi:hypothetical protein